MKIEKGNMFLEDGKVMLVWGGKPQTLAGSLIDFVRGFFNFDASKWHSQTDLETGLLEAHPEIEAEYMRIKAGIKACNYAYEASTTEALCDHLYEEVLQGKSVEVSVVETNKSVSTETGGSTDEWFVRSGTATYSINIRLYEIEWNVDGVTVCKYAGRSVPKREYSRWQDTVQLPLAVGKSYSETTECDLM